jgi:hypothetical protein
MLESRADTFCLVTRDSDFACLCRKLRERSAAVHIVGDGKTPDALRNAADGFFEWRPSRSRVEAEDPAKGGLIDFVWSEASAGTAAPADPAAPDTGSDSIALPADSPWQSNLMAAGCPRDPHRPRGPGALRDDVHPLTDRAVAFIQWVQQGLADGSLAYNEPGAAVHFVEAGIALISPRIFIGFAKLCREAQAGTVGPAPKCTWRAIQHAVLQAKWHLPSPIDETNIWTFDVSRRNSTRATISRLSAVVLADARRWVIDPPPPNSALKVSVVDPSWPLTGSEVRAATGDAPARAPETLPDPAPTEPAEECERTPPSVPAAAPC